MSVDEQIKETKAEEKAIKKQKQEEKDKFLSELAAHDAFLKPHLNKLVSYRYEGARIGYLVEIGAMAGDVQPVGMIKGIRPPLVSVPLLDIQPESGPTKYPTLAAWAKACGWEEKAKVK